MHDTSDTEDSSDNILIPMHIVDELEAHLQALDAEVEDESDKEIMDEPQPQAINPNMYKKLGKNEIETPD